MRLRLALLAIVVATACGEEPPPATYVDKLRILSVTATPPDLAPGDTAVLKALVVDPSRPGKKNTLVWLACDPDPQDLTRSSCSDVSTLSDPAAFTGGELPPGVRAIGFGDFAAYKAPPETFAALDASDTRRIQGAVAQVLLIAIAAEVPPNPTQEELDGLFAKVKSKEIASLIAIFRIRVTEDPERNSNPTVSELKVNGQTLPEGATLRLFPDRDTSLEFIAPNGDFEEYDQLTPEGTETRVEKLIAAFYSTTGRFEQERLELGSGTPQAFQAPTNKPSNRFPEDRRGTMWVVLRDTRGGQSFRTLPFVLCDDAAVTPELATLTPSRGPADGSQRVTLTGRNLSSVLDVIVGEKALTDLRYDSTRDVLEGTVPVLPPGEYALVVRGEQCADVTTSFTYRTP